MFRIGAELRALGRRVLGVLLVASVVGGSLAVGLPAPNAQAGPEQPIINLDLVGPGQMPLTLVKARIWVSGGPANGAAARKLTVMLTFDNKTGKKLRFAGDVPMFVAIQGVPGRLTNSLGLAGVPAGFTPEPGFSFGSMWSTDDGAPLCRMIHSVSVSFYQPGQLAQTIAPTCTESDTRPDPSPSTNATTNSPSAVQPTPITSSNANVLKPGPRIGTR